MWIGHGVYNNGIVFFLKVVGYLFLFFFSLQREQVSSDVVTSTVLTGEQSITLFKNKYYSYDSVTRNRSSPIKNHTKKNDLSRTTVVKYYLLFTTRSGPGKRGEDTDVLFVVVVWICGTAPTVFRLQ